MQRRALRWIRSWLDERRRRCEDFYEENIDEEVGETQPRGCVLRLSLARLQLELNAITVWLLQAQRDGAIERPSS